MTTASNLVDLVTQYRMMIYDHFPYIAPYIYSLTPVERPGIGTMAVDKYGRMYYDPAFCDKITLEEGGYVVCHEGWHLILRHCHRFVVIPTAHCMNLASAVSTVLYDRSAKRINAGLEDPVLFEDEQRGFIDRIAL